MTAGRGRWRRRIGLALSGLVIGFMLLDAAAKFMALEVVVRTTGELGYPATPEFARGLGVLALACTLIYAYPRTAVLGAILLTGYMGGTVATHLRMGSPIVTHMLFGVWLAAIAWGGLYLREARLRALLPLRTAGVH